MSPKKLAATLAGILRDFEPWRDPDRDHQWGGPRVDLSEEQVRALPPFSVFLALVTFSNFPYYGRNEKIAWTVPVRYKGVPYLISHQKFGLRIHPANPAETNLELNLSMVDRLLHAVRISDGLVKPFAEAQIAAGNVTIDNQGSLYLGKYRFFREKAKECFEVPGRMPGEDSVTSINRKLKADREGFFYASAALEAYFSYLEHALVLVLAFCKFDPAKDNLVKFIASTWTDKFKRIYGLAADNEAERVYHSLLRIKEKFRNPLSHGGFDRDATALYFHVPGLGALPVSLSRYAESIHSGFNPIRGISFNEACEALDKAEGFFENGSRRLEMHCVRSGISVAFDDRNLRRYEEAIESEANADVFIESTLTENGQCDEHGLVVRQGLVCQLLDFATLPHALDLFFGKPKPLTLADANSSFDLHIVELVNVALIGVPEVGRPGQPVQFLDRASFGFRVMLTLGLRWRAARTPAV